MEDINMEQKYEKLIDAAFDSLKYCYTPYSKFNVGAALLGKNQKI